MFEAAAAAMRINRWSAAAAQAFVEQAVAVMGLTIVSVDGAIGSEAVAAFGRFGKGRHQAALNMGDCFAYAAARVLAVGLLFKGEDFPLTDIPAA